MTEALIEARAAVQFEPGETLSLREVTLNAPGAGEVLVKIKATGICHTDYSTPGVLTPLPVIPGHEGAGVVEALGKDVSGIDIGDHVLMSFGSCGDCNRCNDGHPHDCLTWPQINFGCARANGEPGAFANGEPVHTSFFKQSSFATYAVATTRNLVKIDKDLPLDLYAPLGCGFIAGAGTVLNELKPAAGDSIVIFGCGPVGLAAVMGARIHECDPLIVVDINNDRLNLAKELGATHTINPLDSKPVEEIHKLTNGGADYSVETAGVVDSFTGAIDAIRAGGTCGMLTVPNGTEPFMYSPLHILFGKTVKGIIEGGSDPQQFIPRLIALHQDGKFPIEKLICFYDFEQLVKAMDDAKAGKVVKAVLRIKN